MIKYGVCLAVVLLTGCVGSSSGPYALPGYYQPSQVQSPYVAAGFNDDMGNYHPPAEHPGGVMYGRWYRPQPGNPGISPNALNAMQNPQASYYTEIAKMASDGDDGTALVGVSGRVPN